MQEDDSCFCSPLLQESGLSVWIGGRLHPLEGVPPPVAVILITSVIALFTEFASNTATIIIFLPVLAELVRSSHGKTSSSYAPSLPCPLGGQVCVGFVLGQALGSSPAPGLFKTLGSNKPCSITWTLKDNNPSDFVVRYVIIYHRVWDRALHTPLAICSL